MQTRSGVFQFCLCVVFESLTLLLCPEKTVSKIRQSVLHILASCTEKFRRCSDDLRKICPIRLEKIFHNLCFVYIAQNRVKLIVRKISSGKARNCVHLQARYRCHYSSTMMLPLSANHACPGFDDESRNLSSC